MAEFSTMMIKFCPATCGLCLAKRCRDQIEECDTMKSLCSNEIYSIFMEHQCARTCGKCRVESEATSEEEFVSVPSENRKNTRLVKNEESNEVNNEKSEEEIIEPEKEKIKVKEKDKAPKRGRPKAGKFSFIYFLLNFFHIKLTNKFFYLLLNLIFF